MIAFNESLRMGKMVGNPHPVFHLLFEVPGRQDLDQQKDVDLSLFLKVG